MEIVSWVIVGIVAGSLARLAMHGPAAGGMPVAILIGLIGAFMGGIFGMVVSMESSTPLVFFTPLLATSGAMILLFIYRSIAMRWE